MSGEDHRRWHNPGEYGRGHGAPHAFGNREQGYRDGQNPPDYSSRYPENHASGVSRSNRVGYSQLMPAQPVRRHPMTMQHVHTRESVTPPLSYADLMALEHVAGTYELPDSLVDTLSEALLAPNPSAELPGWLAARLLVRGLGQKREKFRESEDPFPAERLCETLSNLGNYVSRDPGLPEEARQLLVPPGSILADLRHIISMATLRQELSSGPVSTEPSTIAVNIVDKVFFSPGTSQCEEELARGRHLVTQLSSARGIHPFQALGGSETFSSLRARVDAGVLAFHGAARGALGPTMLSFMQRNLEQCGPSISEEQLQAVRDPPPPQHPHTATEHGADPMLARDMSNVNNRGQR